MKCGITSENFLFMVLRSAVIFRTRAEEHTTIGADRSKAGWMPWIRTFMGRIEKLESSNPQLKKKFDQDMEQLYSMYFGEVQNDIS